MIRRLASWGGVVALVAVAGCAGGDSEDDSAMTSAAATPLPPPTRTVEHLAPSGQKVTARVYPRTDEEEAEEAAPATRPELHTRPRANDGASYIGTARKTAKTSISSAPVQTYASVSALRASLPTAAHMLGLHIPVADTSGRVSEENRNVTVTAWIYVATKEANDNDYHLLIGTDPSQGNRQYFNAEVSGLPPAAAPSFATLKRARDRFESIVAGAVPEYGTYTEYEPAAYKVRITGSLFWDETHSGNPCQVGHGAVHPCTAWEIHPITSIEPLGR